MTIVKAVGIVICALGLYVVNAPEKGTDGEPSVSLEEPVDPA